MPSSTVLFVLGGQLALMTLTAIFLTQPKWIVSSQSVQVKKVFTGIGLFLFCLTFCWSVILGVVLTLNGYSIRI